MCVCGWGGDNNKKQLPFTTIIKFKILSSAVILWKSKSAYGTVRSGPNILHASLKSSVI